jgi:hypothetical protein
MYVYPPNGGQGKEANLMFTQTGGTGTWMGGVSGLPTGTYNVMVVLTDKAGNFATKTVSVTVN